MLDLIDKKIINSLQKQVPLIESPFTPLATELGISVDEIVDRIQRLKDESYLTRFGPLYNIENFDGVFLLAAMEVPVDSYEKITTLVNEFPEVAHNYKRKHQLNMWFVLAVEDKSTLDVVCKKIETATGLKIYQMPKLKEYYINLYFDVLEGDHANQST